MAFPDGWIVNGDGTVWPTDEAIRRALPACDFWPPDPHKGDLAQREDGSLWVWTGDQWFNGERGYFREG